MSRIGLPAPLAIYYRYDASLVRPCRVFALNIPWYYSGASTDYVLYELAS